ncbi:MAG TPA: serine hydrolase [Pyrinomonadaceae bacterium]
MCFIPSKRFIILALLCFFSVQFTLAQTPAASSQTAEQIASKIDEYMNAAMKVERFSGSILAARGGQPIISKGYGLANAELKVPNTTQTVFRLGSLTKQFTAVAVMQLQERGKLNVSDSICKHLADCPAAWQAVTVRNLLNHTSGIPNDSDFPEFAKIVTLPRSTADLIGLLKDKPLDFAPGEKFAYSNSGYKLLGVIIERVSGKTYADFLQENIFAPLGMKQTGYDDNRRVIQNRAAGYAWQADRMLNAAYVDMSVPYAAAALYSTTGDVSVWEQALHTEKLVSRKSLDEIFTPFKNGYGYGWGIGKRFDRTFNFHSGNIFGFAAFIARFPSERVSIIVLSNNQNAPAAKIAENLSAIVFGAAYEIPQERKQVAVEPKTLEKYVGQYQVAPTFVITVTLEDGKLMGQATSQPKFEMLAESETRFLLKAINAQVTFVKDTAGQVTNLILQQGGRNIPAQKIK